MSRELELLGADGVRLAATLFEASSSTPSRAVAVQGAVGVPQRFYAKFAEYLSRRGFTTLIYDYRGVGRSRTRPSRGDPAHLLDWAERDTPAAWDALEAAAPGARLFAVGHSFGGQTMGLLPRSERIAAMLAVGSQSGYWKHWQGLARLAMWGFTHVAIPATATVFGYAAASRIGMGEDLPRDVALEWVRWCRDPEYVVGALGAHDRYAQIRVPLRVISPTDDRFAPERAVRALLALYPNAKGEIRRVAPAELGVPEIGHFGFFREHFRDSLWREAADWLEAQ